MLLPLLTNSYNPGLPVTANMFLRLVIYKNGIIFVVLTKSAAKVLLFLHISKKNCNFARNFINMELLLLFLFGAMGVSFLCSLLESVLMTTTFSYINLREEEDYGPAKLMKQYKEDTGRPLAAILC